MSRVKQESVGDDSLQVMQAINVLAVYIVANGNIGINRVQGLLNKRVTALKHQSAVRESIRKTIKEVLNEATVK